MRNYDVTLTGTTPILMHPDDIPWQDEMEEWKNNPENKMASKAGDDRTPAFRWIGHTYHDEENVAVPQENIMRCVMEGGAMVPIPKAKNGKTFKSQTQSGMMCGELYWTLYVDGQTINWSPIEALRAEPQFSQHKKSAKEMGFDLLVKRAKIGMSKHIRVRPVFAAGWQLRGTIVVWDEQITDEALANIFAYAGNYKGLCDWRPGGRTPGPYGRFEAVITKRA